jgi:hypothetical protein
MAALPSVLSLAASGIYSLVILTCVVAALAASRSRQPSAHWRTWALIALLFAAFILLRLVGAEDWLRETARASLRASGEYDHRRQIQAPIVAAIVAVAGLGFLAFLHRATRNLRGRRNVARLAAITASVAMTFLILVRLASLHVLDMLLYGPLKLNWVIDVGASVVVILAAVYYARVVRARP